MTNDSYSREEKQSEQKFTLRFLDAGHRIKSVGINNLKTKQTWS